MTTIGNAYTKYLQNLKEGSKELTELLSHSGFKDKNELMEAWLNKGSDAITLTFSTNTGDDGPNSHEMAGSQNYVHPDGQGNLAGAMASYTNNTITFSKSLYGLSQYMNGHNFVQKAKGGKDFDYAADKDAANLFTSRITSHEVVHWGRDRRGLSPGVPDGLSPDLRPFDVAFENPSIWCVYEAGQHWEYRAFQQRVTYTDVQYGFAVNIYYRCLAKYGCTLQKGPDGRNITPSPSQISSINAGIKNFIIQNYNQVFKWTNNVDAGTYTGPEPTH